MEEIVNINPDAEKIMERVRSNVSLNSIVGEDGELSDLQGVDNTEEFDRQVDVDIILTKLQSMVSPRDYKILTMRYGLCGEEELTLDEVGKVFSLTRARIHQVERKCISLARQLVWNVV